MNDENDHPGDDAEDTFAYRSAIRNKIVTLFKRDRSISLYVSEIAHIVNHPEPSVRKECWRMANDGILRREGSKYCWHLDDSGESQGLSQRVSGRSHVYFIRSVNGGPVKIGFTKNVKKRLATLQNAHPYKLIVLGVIRNAGPMVEKQLHYKFAGYRLLGEWFEWSQELEDEIRKRCGGEA